VLRAFSLGAGPWSNDCGGVGRWSNGNVGFRWSRSAETAGRRDRSHRQRCPTTFYRSPRVAVTMIPMSAVYAPRVTTHARPSSSDIAGFSPSPSRAGRVYELCLFQARITMRMHMRRFTRLTNAFSKKAENHAHAVILHVMYYKAAGVADRLWEIAHIAELVEDAEAKPPKRSPYNKRAA